MGFEGVSNFRVGKVIEFDIDTGSAEEASVQVEAMGDRLLSNPVIETYRYTVRGDDDQHGSIGIGAGSRRCASGCWQTR